MIFYIENPRNLQNTTRINEFNKVTGYKINIQKSIICLYTNNKHMETKIKNVALFTTAQKDEIVRYNKICIRIIC